MRYIYNQLLLLLLPLVVLRLLWRSIKSPNYRRRIGERLGLLPPIKPGGIWLHAVSVGEVQASIPLIQHFLSTRSQLPLLITTTTPTGSQRVMELFGDKIYHTYAPYDLPIIVRRFLARVQPKLAIFMETEVWPNILYQCQLRGIPTLLANARLSERSASRYARWNSFSQTTFNCFTQVIAQSTADAERLIQLGIAANKVTVTGSIKFDVRLATDLYAQAALIKQCWGADRPVWIAASTHEGEDELVLAAQQQILHTVPNALLVLVPRHPERFVKVGALIGKQGLGLVRRSEKCPCTAATQVFLGDSMGELPVFFAAADVAFVGGSLVPHGGHNLLEPAALGIPVVTGMHVTNFAHVTEMLLAHGAACQVASAAELATTVANWLNDAATRTKVGNNGRQVVEQNRGALNKLIHIIETYC